jgi:hypothetical protein
VKDLNMKKHSLIRSLVGLTIALFASLAFAAPPFPVSTGESKLTYSQMFAEQNKQCPAEASALSVSELQSSGSNDNLNNILTNVAKGGWVQGDVLAWRSRAEDLTSIKTLLAMHLEEVHIVTLAAWDDEDAGWFKKKAVSIKTIEDLVGRKVAATGGSLDTARLIRAKTGINFVLDETMPSTAKALEALAARQIHAVVIVGGSPLKALQALNGATHRLVAIPEPVQTKLDIYQGGQRLLYSNMGPNGVVPTVAIRAQFVVSVFNTPETEKALQDYRVCVVNNIATLRGKTGTHPKWRGVPADQLTNPASRGKWAWF